MSQVAVLTIAHGRHDHLAEVLVGCERSLRRPDLVVVCAMDDPGIEPLVRRSDLPTEVVHLPRHELGLPLAAARNRAAALALSRGADVLVFLDVDCIPSPTLIGRYAHVLETRVHEVPLIAAGEVAYLPDAAPYDHERLEDLADPHPARPVLAPEQVETASDLDLFWSLSFAVTAQSWCAVAGFDETYVGYGGEDTDFAARVAERRGTMVWVGGARVYHQFHENRMPPVHHLDAIVRNAHVFHRRWGRWPMIGWLQEFDRMGLVRFDGERLSISSAAPKA